MARIRSFLGTGRTFVATVERDLGKNYLLQVPPVTWVQGDEAGYFMMRQVRFLCAASLQKAGGQGNQPIFWGDFS
jgi:hypothetical protein